MGVKLKLPYYAKCMREADHSGRAVYDMNCLHPLEHWDRGFKFHSRHGCLFVFILCLCQVAVLRRADPPSKEFCRLS
jgi:hypothetical protein